MMLFPKNLKHNKSNILETQLHNSYLFKALDAYPYSLEETVENLNYALSYDEDNVQGLYLLGLLFAEQLFEYENAKGCFEEVLALDINFIRVYPDYAYCLILNEDFEEAEKLLKYALTIKATDKAVLTVLQAHLFECQAKLKKALKTLKRSKKLGRNSNFICFINTEIKRVKDKIPKAKKKKKAKKSKKRKKKRKK